MKNKIIVMLIGWSLMYLIFFRLLPYLTDKYHGCYIHQDVYKQVIKSTILDKYVDSKNHNYETITYIGRDNKEETMVFTPEFGALYDFLNIGDSIIKEKSSIYYKVKSKATSKDTTFK
ncbi:MAG: hypothetical protein ACXVJD_13655, partial [Mucilaginibacter sp.]